jgi:Trypsin-co-occurring domain 2
MHAGEHADIRFEMGTIEVELTVTVEKEAKPGAKVRFWVVEVGGEARVASSSLQRIKLTLEPRRAGQLDRKPFVSGPEIDGER